MCPCSLVGHLETAIGHIHALTWYEVPCEKSQKYGDFQLIFLCLVILPKLAENELEMCRDKKSFVNYVYLLFLVQIMPNEA